MRKLLFALTVLTCCTFILTVVLIGSRHQKRSVIQKRGELVQVPHNDENINYSEVNLKSYRSLCAKRNDLYSSLPKLPLRGLLPKPHTLTSEVTPSLKATLNLDDNGEIIYVLNSFTVWRSNSPRSYFQSSEVNILKEVMVQSKVEEWKFSIETSNGLRLHLAPLAITASDGMKRKIVWTFMSGWDAAGIQNAKEIPAPLNFKESGEFALISKNRKFRLALLPNADLIILESGAEKPKDVKFSVSLKSSLQYKYCS